MFEAKATIALNKFESAFTIIDEVTKIIGASISIITKRHSPFHKRDRDQLLCCLTVIKPSTPISSRFERDSCLDLTTLNLAS